VKNTTLTVAAAAMFFVFPLCAMSRAQAQEQVKNEAQNVERISDEDKEIIENIELFENLDLFLEGDIEMIHNLDLFLANS